MAQNETPCDSADVPTPEYRVTSVVVVGAAALRVLTEVEGDAALFVELGDALNPSSWALAVVLGDLSPPLVQGAVVVDETLARGFVLTLDAPLVTGASYTLGLQPWARARYGQATNTTPVPFVGPVVLPPKGLGLGEPGADIAVPMSVGKDGDIAKLGRLDALRARAFLMVESRRGSFDFSTMETFGRGTDPKRTFPTGKILAECSALKAALRLDPDIENAAVSAKQIPDGVLFDLSIKPSFQEEPLTLQSAIRLG